MLAKGFAIKKELVNGKTVKEVGLFGDFNKSGARIIEMNDGKAKYTELSSQDIHQLLGIRSNPSDLLERLVPMLKLHKHKSHKRHKKSHRRHKRSHRRHKRSHRRHKRSHKRHKRSHKRHRHKSHRHKRHKSHRHKSHRHKSHRSH